MAVIVLGFAARPVVDELVRSLDVLAVVAVRFLGATAFSICCTMRGLLLPVLARVEAGMMSVVFRVC